MHNATHSDLNTLKKSHSSLPKAVSVTRKIIRKEVCSLSENENDSMKSTNKENPALTFENNYHQVNQMPNNSNSISSLAKMQQKPEHSSTTEQEILPNRQNGDKTFSQEEEDNDVFEVKMRKNRRSGNRNNEDDETRNRRSSNSAFENHNISSPSFLNSKTYSYSTLSLNKSSIFPTGTGSKKKKSISMSLSRGGGSDGEDNVKITGYLEKRSKLVSSCL